MIYKGWRCYGTKLGFLRWAVHCGKDDRFRSAWDSRGTFKGITRKLTKEDK